MRQCHHLPHERGLGAAGQHALLALSLELRLELPQLLLYLRVRGLEVLRQLLLRGHHALELALQRALGVAQVARHGLLLLQLQLHLVQRRPLALQRSLQLCLVLRLALSSCLRLGECLLEHGVLLLRCVQLLPHMPDLALQRLVHHLQRGRLGLRCVEVLRELLGCARELLPVLLKRALQTASLLLLELQLLQQLVHKVAHMGSKSCLLLQYICSCLLLGCQACTDYCPPPLQEGHGWCRSCVLLCLWCMHGTSLPWLL
mmetsp:Transcript_7650/g.18977  ORF Transcript_7650/g.18977 Transcript_7650/m.18977 type:complete len:259 (+) Transcript_7650:187-963(+)